MRNYIVREVLTSFSDPAKLAINLDRLVSAIYVMFRHHEAQELKDIRICYQVSLIDLFSFFPDDLTRGN